VLGDRVAFRPDGDFDLTGRADRVVKVAEKRLSLPDMEARLKTHPALEEVVLVDLEHRGETRVGAVVVVSERGRAVLAEGGRRALSKALTEHLTDDFDRVLLPRAWRVVAELPRDAQGKLPTEVLRALFAAGEELPRKPEVLALRRDAQQLEYELRIPENLAFLEGHFPSFPIVAGVVQVHFVMAALEELVGGAARLATLEALKFRDVLLPGQQFRLRVALSEGGERFTFALTDTLDPGRVFSSGRGQLRIAP
jgi:3-hydroxymyristoyl/3-hydroxydecanoyl-(acyl carrier protein) dehydratase